MINKKDEKSFINDLVDSFPEIKEDVLDETFEGLIGLQLGYFRKFTQIAIDANDIETLNRCFRFVDENFENVIFKIENSLVVSYLGHLDFSRNPNAEKILSKKIKEILKGLEMHMKQSKNDKLSDFFKNI